MVQVYGWLVDNAGRVLVQDTGDRFNLPAAHRSRFDVDLAATVVQEAMEESQVTVTDVVYLGYEQVQRASRVQALVRTSTGLVSSRIEGRLDVATIPVRRILIRGSTNRTGVQVLLDSVCEVELWTQGVFGLMQGTLESLVMALSRFDFVVLVLTADDLTISCGAEKTTARDNVLFELGLFIGSLGRDRTFMFYDRMNPPALPSDLAGITATTFAPHASGNLDAAMGAPCTKIQNGIERLGVRQDRGFRDLERATLNVEGAGVTMQLLIRLLARSRKVELDIIATQFGSAIGSQQLQKMKRDLADLEKTLGEE